MATREKRGSFLKLDPITHELFLDDLSLLINTIKEHGGGLTIEACMEKTQFSKIRVMNLVETGIEQGTLRMSKTINKRLGEHLVTLT